MALGDGPRRRLTANEILVNAHSLSIQVDQDFGHLGVFAKYSKAFQRKGSDRPVCLRWYRVDEAVRSR